MVTDLRRNSARPMCSADGADAVSRSASVHATSCNQLEHLFSTHDEKRYGRPMPKLNRKFYGVRFAPKVMRAAFEQYEKVAHKDYLARAAAGPHPEETVAKGVPDNYVQWTDLSVDRGSDTWTFDSADEYFSELLSDYSSAGARTKVSKYGNLLFTLSVYHYPTHVSVVVETPKRSDLLKVMSIFDEAVPESRLPVEEQPTWTPPRPKIFIGHGGASQDWLVLQNDLQNVHKLQVESFETGERAGHSIRDVLEGFLDTNNFAILVFSKADEQADGSFRARQNVVHEAGLFQGKLGFQRAIILRDEGVEVFSNVDGVQYISYRTGDILGAVGRIIAVLNREFPGVS